MTSLLGREPAQREAGLFRWFHTLCSPRSIVHATDAPGTSDEEIRRREREGRSMEATAKADELGPALEAPVAVLHVAPSSVSVTGMARLLVAVGQATMHEQDTLRIVCKLLESPLLSSDDASMMRGKDSSLHLLLPPDVTWTKASSNSSSPNGVEQHAQLHQPWLQVQAVSVSVCSRGSSSSSSSRSLALPHPDHATSWLGNLARKDPEFSRVLSAVAMSVSAPLYTSSKQATHSSTYITRDGHSPAGIIKVSSSFIRNPRNGALSPALILDCQGLLSEQLTTLLAAGPDKATAFKIIGPLASVSDHADDGIMVMQQQQQQLLLQQQLLQQQQQQLQQQQQQQQQLQQQQQQQQQLQQQQQQQQQLQQQQQQWLAVAQQQHNPRADLHQQQVQVVEPAAGVKGKGGAEAGILDLTATSTSRVQKLRSRGMKKLVRSHTMVSTVPCIMTLLELTNGDGLSDDDDEEEGAGFGRVLLQNEQSLTYWGKMDLRNRTGSQDLLTCLFEKQPGAIYELFDQLSDQWRSPRHLLENGHWKKVVQVTCLQHVGSRSQLTDDSSDDDSRRSEQPDETDDCPADEAAAPDISLQAALAPAVPLPPVEGSPFAYPPNVLYSPSRASVPGPGPGSFERTPPVSRMPSIPIPPMHYEPRAVSSDNGTSGNFAGPASASRLPIPGPPLPRIRGAGSDTQASQVQHPLLGASPSNRVQSLLSVLENKSNLSVTTSVGSAMYRQEQLPITAFLAHPAPSADSASSAAARTASALSHTIPNALSPSRSGFSGIVTNRTASAFPDWETSSQHLPPGGSSSFQEPPGRYEAHFRAASYAAPSYTTSYMSYPIASSSRSPSQPSLTQLVPRSHSHHVPAGAMVWQQVDPVRVKSPAKRVPSVRAFNRGAAPLTPASSMSTAFSGGNDAPGPSVSLRVLKLSLLAGGTPRSPSFNVGHPIAAASVSEQLPKLAIGAAGPSSVQRMDSGVGSSTAAAAVQPPPFERRSMQVRSATPTELGSGGTSAKLELGAASASSGLLRELVQRQEQQQQQQPPRGESHATDSFLTVGNDDDTVEIEDDREVPLLPQPPLSAHEQHEAGVHHGVHAGTGLRGSDSSEATSRASARDSAAAAPVRTSGAASSTGLSGLMSNDGSDPAQAAEQEAAERGEEGEECDEEGEEGEDEGEEESGDEEEEEELRWHEVQALATQDPVTGKEAVLLLQTDVTNRVLTDKRMAILTETQLMMLENMFPRHVLEFMVGSPGPNANLSSLAHLHEQVTILFMDIVGFTSMSKEVAPQLVMQFLNELFSKFDHLCDVHSVYKVETAGDCYIVAGALMMSDDEGFISLNPEADPVQGARNVVAFARAMLRHARTVTMPHNQQPTGVRIGIHTGSVVSGLIGNKLPKFSLFGDTMNTSSRMESTSKPGCIQISEETYSILEAAQQALFSATGGVEVKGKGLMPTYLFSPSVEDLQLNAEDLVILQGTGVAMQYEQAGGTARQLAASSASAAELLVGRFSSLSSNPRQQRGSALSSLHSADLRTARRTLGGGRGHSTDTIDDMIASCTADPGDRHAATVPLVPSLYSSGPLLGTTLADRRLRPASGPSSGIRRSMSGSRHETWVGMHGGAPASQSPTNRSRRPSNISVNRSSPNSMASKLSRSSPDSFGPASGNVGTLDRSGSGRKPKTPDTSTSQEMAGEALAVKPWNLVPELPQTAAGDEKKEAARKTLRTLSIKGESRRVTFDTSGSVLNEEPLPDAGEDEEAGDELMQQQQTRLQVHRQRRRSATRLAGDELHGLPADDGSARSRLLNRTRSVSQEGGLPLLDPTDKADPARTLLAQGRALQYSLAQASAAAEGSVSSSGPEGRSSARRRSMTLQSSAFTTSSRSLTFNFLKSKAGGAGGAEQQRDAALDTGIESRMSAWQSLILKTRRPAKEGGTSSEALLRDSEGRVPSFPGLSGLNLVARSSSMTTTGAPAQGSQDRQTRMLERLQP